ncbi:MAG: flagellar motor protein MotA, partial [Kiloniellales bacterium]
IDWLEHLQRESSGRLIFPGSMSEKRPPRLLAPMATMLGERRGRISLSAISMRTLVDGIQSRIQESHEISRYLIGLLIFLGLLGTFWGLLETVRGVSNTIAGLGKTATDPAVLFDNFIVGLKVPVSGMGTAFSSSLFGLAGSLVLGFLELQSGQAHNRFLNELEEWLSGLTRLSSAGPVSDGEHSVPAFIQALLEKTADSLDQLQHTISRGEGERNSVNQSLLTLTERLGTLTDHMRTEQGVLIRLAEMQAEMKNVVTQLIERAPASGGMDESTRSHIRNLDVRIEHLINDLASGREYAVQEIRGEIRLLTRTIAAMAEEAE